MGYLDHESLICNVTSGYRAAFRRSGHLGLALRPVPPFRQAVPLTLRIQKRGSLISRREGSRMVSCEGLPKFTSLQDLYSDPTNDHSGYIGNF